MPYKRVSFIYNILWKHLRPRRNSILISYRKVMWTVSILLFGFCALFCIPLLPTFQALFAIPTPCITLHPYPVLTAVASHISYLSPHLVPLYTFANLNPLGTVFLSPLTCRHLVFWGTTRIPYHCHVSLVTEMTDLISNFLLNVSSQPFSFARTRTCSAPPIFSNLNPHLLALRSSPLGCLVLQCAWQTHWCQLHEEITQCMLHVRNDIHL